MAVLNLSDDNEACRTLRDWIHQTYGKPANLLRDEYNVVIDTEITDNLRIASGPCVILIIPYWPNDARFQPILSHIFKDYDLKKFLRSKALIRLSDAEKWYSASESGYFRKVDKKVGYDTCVVRYITSLEVIDKKTKRSVRVEVEGNAFEARSRAVKLLYPESDHEEAKEALRRARRNKKGGEE